MSSNSTYPGDPSGGMFSADKIGGFGYGIGVSLGILILITTITLTSYFCTRSVAQTTRDGLASPTTTIIEEDDLELGIDEATLKTCPELLYADAKKLMIKESKEGMKKGLRGAMISSATSACCSVCLGDYKDYDAVRILPDCGHMFHVACVDTWLRLRPTCPVCRTSPLPSPLSTPLAEVVPLARQPS